MIGTTKEYDMAVALLQFRAAYRRLVAASKAMPDLDISEAYPFYLLDFEVIEPAVLQWCSIHAAKLMETLPDIVANPACFNCAHLGSGVNAAGMCAGDPACPGYPIVSFTAAACKPALINAGYDVSKLSDAEVELLYIQEVQKRVTEGKKSDG